MGYFESYCTFCMVPFLIGPWGKLTDQDIEDIRTSQLIVAKTLWKQNVRIPHFVPEETDEDFESGRCFLSGISKQPYSECDWLATEVRHGVVSIGISNATLDPYPKDIELETSAIPFHPACFEMYKRICLEKIGVVDIDAIWEMRHVVGNDFYEDKGIWEGGSDLRDLLICRSQWWQHEYNMEYLAANPVKAFGLEELLRQAKDRTRSAQYGSDPGSHPTNSSIPKQSDYRLNNSDPFVDLPRELVILIMEQLHPSDISRMQLVTRTFHHVPNNIFKHFIEDDMPWFWEIQDFEKQQDTMDYRFLYKGLKGMHGNPILGLQNRKRIWKNLEVKVQRVGKWRSMGGLNAYNPDDWKEERESRALLR